MSKRNPSAEKGQLSQFQKFKVERWARGQIKNAPYNPRTITKDAERRLKKNLEEVGLLGPVTVNRRTGNLVAGHKRLAILDRLEKSDGYTLDVAVCDLTPKREREQNVFMNATTAQGDWDVVALAGLFSADADIKLDLGNTGFDEMSLEMTLGEAGEGIFGENSAPEEVQETVEDMAAMLDAKAKEADAAKGRRQKMRAKTKQVHEDTDTERIAWIVFPSREACSDWLERIGMDRETRYVPCSKIASVEQGAVIDRKRKAKR